MAFPVGMVLGSTALATIGSAVAGGAAASAQRKAAEQANQQLTLAQRQAAGYTEPYRNAGTNALAPQQALLGIGGGVGANGMPVGSTDWGAYLKQYGPEIQAFYNRYGKAFKKLGSDWTAAAEQYYKQVGQMKGHEVPKVAGPVGSDGQPLTQQQISDQAYQTFLNSGNNRAMTDFTNADLQQVAGAFGAGGKSLSGSAVGAMGDRLARNRYGAYSDYTNALSGLSSQGAQLSSNLGAQGMQTAQQIGANNMQSAAARGSSYMNTANALGSGLQSAAGLYAYGSGAGWFGGGGTGTGGGVGGAAGGMGGSISSALRNLRS